jgi:hypothetical protein
MIWHHMKSPIVTHCDGASRNQEKIITNRGMPIIKESIMHVDAVLTLKRGILFLGNMFVSISRF